MKKEDFYKNEIKMIEKEMKIKSIVTFVTIILFLGAMVLVIVVGVGG